MISSDGEEFVLGEDILLVEGKTASDLEEMLPFKATIISTAGTVTEMTFTI